MLTPQSHTSSTLLVLYRSIYNNSPNPDHLELFVVSVALDQRNDVSIALPQRPDDLWVPHTPLKEPGVAEGEGGLGIRVWMEWWQALHPGSSVVGAYPEWLAYSASWSSTALISSSDNSPCT